MKEICILNIFHHIYFMIKKEDKRKIYYTAKNNKNGICFRN
jgi:hypothetical protein